MNAYQIVNGLAPMSRVIGKHLLDVGTISAIEAQALYKCRSLSRRICDLQRAGITVNKEFKKDHTGQRYVRYSVPRPNFVLAA